MITRHRDLIFAILLVALGIAAMLLPAVRQWLPELVIGAGAGLAVGLIARRAREAA